MPFVYDTRLIFVAFTFRMNGSFAFRFWFSVSTNIVVRRSFPMAVFMCTFKMEMCLFFSLSQKRKSSSVIVSYAVQ